MSIVSIAPADMQATFERILLKYEFAPDKATVCARIFTANSVDGIYTHGVNRFSRFVQYIREGYVSPGATPSLKNKSGNVEQWNGNLGPGPLNAAFATDRAMQLAAESGIGCVALSHTNHWMRGGNYGWQAAKKGFVFIGFTNTIANMPAWGAMDKKLGNNPLVIALPYGDEAIVLDMAMSQYSYGALEMAALKGETLAVNGGFDKQGELTQDPAAIMESGRPLAMGFWKGAGLSLLLDILVAVLSGGSATWEISREETEYGLSQVFIAIDTAKLGEHSAITTTIRNIVDDYHRSVPAGPEKIIYPGERVLETRKRNLQQGIPVLSEVWEKIIRL
jgi:3-dehydro-L-gulonate 2-dehydrogenase